jgi:hypothetical protein
LGLLEPQFDARTLAEGMPLQIAITISHLATQSRTMAGTECGFIRRCGLSRHYYRDENGAKVLARATLARNPVSFDGLRSKRFEIAPICDLRP